MILKTVFWLLTQWRGWEHSTWLCSTMYMHQAQRCFSSHFSGLARRQAVGHACGVLYRQLPDMRPDGSFWEAHAELPGSQLACL